MICGIMSCSQSLLYSMMGSHLGAVIISGVNDYKCYPRIDITLCWSSCLLKPHLNLGKLVWILASHVCEEDEGRETVNLNDLTV